MNPLTLITDGVGGLLGVAGGAVQGAGNAVSDGIGGIYHTLRGDNAILPVSDAATIGNPTPQPTLMQALPQMAQVFGASYDAAGGGPGFGRGVASGLAAAAPYWKWKDNIRTKGAPNQVQAPSTQPVAEVAQLGPEFVTPSRPDAAAEWPLPHYPVDDGIPDWATGTPVTSTVADDVLAAAMVGSSKDSFNDFHAANLARDEAARNESFRESFDDFHAANLAADEQQAASGIPGALATGATGTAGLLTAKALLDGRTPFRTPPVSTLSSWAGIPATVPAVRQLTEPVQRKGERSHPRQGERPHTRRQAPKPSMGPGASAQARRQDKQQKDARRERIKMQHVRAANASARNAPTARGGARAPMRQAALNFGGTGGIAKVLAPAAAGLTALSIPSYVEAAHTSMGDATIDGQHKAQRAPVVQEVAEYILNGNHISDEEIMLLIGEGAGVDPAAQAKGAWEVRDMVDRVRDAQLEQFNQSRRVATEGRKNDYPAGW